MATSFGIDVTVDARGAATGAQQVRRLLRGISNAARSADTLVDSLDESIEELSTGVSALADAFDGLDLGIGPSDIVTSFASLEQALANIKATTLESEENMGRLEAKAKALGATTQFTSTQIAEGMLQLARGGQSVDDVLQSIGANVNLATASGEDFSELADKVTAIMSMYQMTADRTGEAADILALASSKGAASVLQLAESMKHVGGTAHILGMSLEQTSATLEVLADSSFKGESGGTSLRSVLTSLAAPTDDAKKKMKELGISFKDIDPNKVGLIKALENIKEANLDFDKSVDLVGQEYVGVLKALVEGIPKINSVTESLKNANGTAQKMADIMGDTLIGSYELLMSALDALREDIGNTFLAQPLREFVEDTTKVINALGDLENTSGNIEKRFLNIAKVIKGTAIAVGGLATAFLSLKIGSVVIATLMNPFRALTLAISLGAGLLTSFKEDVISYGKSSFRVADLMTVAWENMNRTVEMTKNTLTTVIEESAKGLKAVNEGIIGETYRDAITGTADMMVGITDLIDEKVIGLKALKNALVDFTEHGRPTKFVKFFEDEKKRLIAERNKKLFDEFTEDPEIDVKITLNDDDLEEDAEGILDGIGNSIALAAEERYKEFLGKIENSGRSSGTGIDEDLAKVEKLFDKMNDSIDKSEEEFKSFFDTLKDNFNSLFEYMKTEEFVEDIGDTIKDVFSDVKTFIEDTVRTGELNLNRLASAVSETLFRASLQSLSEKASDSFVDFLQNTIPEFVGSFAGGGTEKQISAPLLSISPSESQPHIGARAPVNARAPINVVNNFTVSAPNGGVSQPTQQQLQTGISRAMDDVRGRYG